MNNKQLTRTVLASTEMKGAALWFLNKMEERYHSLERATRLRQARQQWLAAIKNLSEDGKIALCHWARDCDMCEGTYRRIMDANVKEIDAMIASDLDWAEGPMHHWLQRPSDSFESDFRDLALEAFEDGHPHVVFA